KNRSGHPQRAAPEAMASNASAPVQLAAAIDAMHTRVQSSITLMIFTGLPSARAQSVESICQHSLARSALKERLARLGRFEGSAPAGGLLCTVRVLHAPVRARGLASPARGPPALLPRLAHASVRPILSLPLRRRHRASSASAAVMPRLLTRRNIRRSSPPSST